MTAIPELIMQTIQSRLQLITVANGYEFDVAEVARPDRKGEATAYKHLGIFLEEGPRVRWPTMDVASSTPKIAYQMDVQIKCNFRQADTTPNSTLENMMHDAVVKAITSVGNWQTFAGKAIYSELGDCEPLGAGDGEEQGCTVHLTVYYRVQENNPSAL